MFYAKPAYLDQEPISGVDAPELPGQYTATSGDVLSTGFDSGVRSSQTFSRTINESSIYDEHNKLVKDLTGQDLPNPAYEDYSTKDISRFYKDYDDARRQGMDWSFGDFKRHWNDQEYRKELALIGTKHPEHQSTILPEKSFISQAYERARQAEQSFANAQERMRPGPGRTLSRLAGEMAGVMLDPVNIATMPLGFAGAGPTFWRGMGLAAIKSGAINAGTEALTAPFVQQYRAEAGLDYGAGQAAFGVMSAFVMGGLLDAGIRGAWRAGRYWGDFAPVVENGIVVGYRRRERGTQIPPELAERAKAGDVDAQAEVAKLTRTDDLIKPETIQRAEALYPAAIREIAEKSGLADENPVVRQTLDTMDANERLNEKPSPLVSDFDHAANVTQAIRHAASPDLEPAPVRVDETPPIPQATAEQIDALTKQVADLKGDVVGLSRLIKNQPETVSEALPVADGDLRLARNLASLEETAFSRVTSGEVNPELAGMVAEFVADPAQHGRMLDDLIRAKPSTPTEARQRIAEFLRSPDYAPQVADTGTAPGLKTKALDDPYGSDAKTQVAALEQQMAEELGRKAEAEVRASTPPDPVEVRAAQEQAISLADQIKAIVREVVGADAADLGVTVRTFSAASDIQSEGLRLQVEQANIAAYGVALDRFTSATSEVERMAARAMMDEARAGRGVQGFADGTDIYLASYAANPKAYVAHELVHALRRLDKLTGEETASLAMRARRIGAFDKALEDAYRKVLEGQGKTGKELAELLDEEAAARLIERYFKGQAIDLPKVQATILDRLAELFATLRTKLRQAMGMGEADVPPQDMANQIIKAFTSGEIARRQVDAQNAAQVRQAMQAEDITALAVKPEMMAALRDGKAKREIEQVWGPKFDILMGQQYRIAEAGGDLSTMYDILSGKLSKASGIDPQMRSAMQQKLRELYDDMGPEGRAAAGITEPPQPAAIKDQSMFAFAGEQIDKMPTPKQRYKLVAAQMDPPEMGRVRASLKGMAAQLGIAHTFASNLNSDFAFVRRNPNLGTKAEAVRYVNEQRLESKDELATMRREAEGQAFYYDIQNQDGVSVGTAHGFVVGKQMYFDWLGAPRTSDKANIGLRAIKDLREQVRKDFPQVTEFVGYRVSGARDKADAANRMQSITMFAFAGEKAKTADLDALSRAQQMADDGIDRTRIWTDTGWFKGVDGKWRFEIDDSHVTLKDIDDQTIAESSKYEFAAVEARHRAKSLQILGSDVGEKQGSGGGTSLYHTLINDALENGKTVHSDGSVSQSAQRIYEGLKSRGYDVTQNDATRTTHGSLMGKAISLSKPLQPVYTIKPFADRNDANAVLARTTMARISMSPDERRARPPWQDYDVPEKDHIVRFAGGEQQAMFALADADTGQSMRRDLDALGYYSRALEAAKALKQAKGTPEQMLAMLKTAGVKQAEIEATNLAQLMDGKSSVTRDEIVKHLEQNRLELKVKTYGTTSMQEVEALVRDLHQEFKKIRGMSDESAFRLAEEFADPLLVPPDREETHRVIYNMMQPDMRRRVDQARSAVEDTRYKGNSLDPSNPSYRETVLHLPSNQKPGWRELRQRIEQLQNEGGIRNAAEINRLRDEADALDGTNAESKDFQSSHFPEPNITGHMMTSMVKHEGRPVYLIDQIQSDWGQKLRDGGVRDVGRIATMQEALQAAETVKTPEQAKDYMAHADDVTVADIEEMFGYADDADYVANVKATADRLRAEIATANAATPGNPLVNTTDQWTTTTLRRAIRQAAEADADYIAIPSGDTVLSYNPGDTEGMRGFYDKIVPKNLRNILQKLDKSNPDGQRIDKLETPSKGMAGDGFTLFPLTDTVKAKVRTEGQAMFALRDEQPAARPDIPSIASRMMEMINPYLDAARSAEAAQLMGMVERDADGNIASVVNDGKRYTIARNAAGDITGITETEAPTSPLNLSITRGDDGLAAAVEANGQSYKIDRDSAGSIAGLAQSQIGDLAAQEATVRQGLAGIIAQTAESYGGKLAPERAEQIAGEALDIARNAPADPVAALNAVTDLVNRTAAEMASPVMFALRDEKGRPKAGAAARMAQLQDDLARIEAEFQASGGDERALLQVKRAALLQAVADEKVLDDLANYRTSAGLSDKAEALMRMMEADAVTGGASDLKTLREVIRNDFLSDMDKMIWHFRKGAITGDKRRLGKGLREDMAEVIRAAAGEKVDNPLAQEFAKSWLAVAEKARQRFNAAGGDIGKLPGWYAPQYHDAEAWLKAGQQTIVDYFVPAQGKPQVLDRTKMLNRDGSQMTDAELRKLIGEIWYTVTTGGANKLEPGETSMGRGALYKQRAEHRVLHYASADAWLAYNREFGGGDVFAAMLGHIDMMARDIAAMERFGPNPTLGIQRAATQIKAEAGMTRSARSVYDDLAEKVDALKKQLRTVPAEATPIMVEIGRIHGELDKLRAQDKNRLVKRNVAAIEKLDDELFAQHQKFREAFGSIQLPDQQGILFKQISDMMDEMAALEAYPVMSKNPVERANRLIGRAEEIWKLYAGHTNTPTSTAIAGTMVSLRNWVGASSLTFASFSSVLSDPVMQMAARAFLGMPVVKQLGSYVSAFSKADRKLALELAVGLDQVQAAFAEQARYVGWLNTRHITGYLADRTHAFSLLSPMTQAQKVAFSLDFMGWMAGLRDSKFSDLPAEARRMMQRHDVSPVDWEAMRAATPEAKGGRTMLTRDAIEATAGTDLADKYMTMLLRERSRAVIEPTLRGRTAFISETKPGTFAGEASRSMAMLKSFPTSYMMNVLGTVYGEIVAGRGRSNSTIAYGAAIFVVGTIAGAMAMQLKNIGHGRDPQDMTKAKFWLEAFMQSGGLGIFGDFIGSSVNRFGGGLAQTLAGPLAGRASTILDLTAGNIAQYANDEKTNIGREFVKSIRQNTPGALVPFYLRQAYERLLLDELQRAVDPDAHRSFQQQRSMLKKRTGQEFYNPPGAPARMPNFGAAFGQ